MSVEPHIIVVSGLPGAGKSTTAALLARRMPRAAHIEADRLQQLLTSGGVLPDASGISAEAARQLRLRLRNACLLARSFLDSGFTAIVDDIVAAHRYDDLVSELRGVPFGFVMLLPDFEHVKARWRAMGSPFVDAWDWIDDDIRSRTPRVGLWLDTTHLTPEETTDIIVERLDETTVTP
jgi:chloramphenicol 3-O-phosphotransferase